tara:strand:- start:625 stop:807 length:183 start_codon:yes stop_codon:yes gene_type:complete
MNHAEEFVDFAEGKIYAIEKLWETDQDVALGELDKLLHRLEKWERLVPLSSKLKFLGREK